MIGSPEFMTRYFFDTAGAEQERDLEGCEFPGLAEAKLAAITFAGAYLRDNPSLILGESAWYVEVRDQSATLLYTVKIEGCDAGEVGSCELTDARRLSSG
jgi:hypothetical protein